MKKIILSYLLYIICSFSLNAQDTFLSFIDDQKKEFFRKNGWELYYSNDDLEFYDYLIFKGDLVLASIDEVDYRIHFLNQERLIEKSRNISGNRNIFHTPKLYLDKGNVVFAPITKFECRIIPEKERIKRKNVLRNLRKRRRGEYFKKYSNYKEYIFYSFSSLNQEGGYQQVEIEFGKDRRNLKSLYQSKMEGDMLTYSANADRLELEFLNDKIIVVDNFKSKLLLFDFDGNILSERKLISFVSESSDNYLPEAVLRKDPIDDRLYLIFHHDLFEILPVEENVNFKKIDFNSDFRFYKAKIHDQYLYSLFSMKGGQGRAIYRKKIEE